MAKKMLIDATHAEETRVVVVDGAKVEEFDFESENKRQLAGNIYLAKVTRVEPSLQAAFVDYGGNRHGFLAFSEIHPDYYQIPVADREALLAEERAYAEAQAAEDDEDKPKRRSRRKPKAASAKSKDAVVKGPAEDGPIGSMDVVDLGPEAEGGMDPVDLVEAEDPGTEGAPTDDVAKPSPEQSEPSADADAARVEDAVDEGTEAEASEEEADAEDGGDDAADAVSAEAEDDDEEKPYVAADDAAERDEDIESVAEEDVSEEIRQPRKPRPRRYKIQEVVKVRQIMLVQVVKEERGNKGAALTTYLSLAGRYCVLMPNTARGGGISRKITNAADRKKLKEIAGSIQVPDGAGLIVRTAGAKRTKTEIKRDYEYLQRLWEQIRELTLKSIAPAKIYEEGDLTKRSIRDLYNREIDEVLVEGEAGYRVAKDFMKMIMPSHAKNVKHYQDPLPLYARYQVETYLSSMFNPTVQLKSGGYIVIGVTEALVAVDVNSGKATKEGSIEETAVKTNLEAAEEVARQLRLRDLAGLIVIDFIDMEERRNNAAVEKRLKERLKTDRARIQVGRISGFGLLEMSRQRLRPGMLEASTQPCPSCHGTGLIRSDDSQGLSILRQLEEEGVRRRYREVLLKAPINVVNFLMNQKREHIAQIEARYGLSVRIEADSHLVSPDYTLERFKTQTRMIDAVAPVVSVDAAIMSELDEALEEEAAEEVAVLTEDGDAKPKKKRRRRRRRKSGADGDIATTADEGEEKPAAEDVQMGGEDGPTEPAQDTSLTEDTKPAKSRRRGSRGSRGRSKSTKTDTDAAAVEAGLEDQAPVEQPEYAAAAPDPKAAPEPEAAPDPEAAPVPKVEETVATAEPAEVAQPVAEVAQPVEPSAPAEPPVETPPEEPVMATASTEDAGPPKPKRRGWWNLGS
ncbi:MAG: Rne/Rng family ribonuclease [Pseudomonadota bacterium]